MSEEDKVYTKLFRVHFTILRYHMCDFTRYVIVEAPDLPYSVNTTTIACRCNSILELFSSLSYGFATLEPDDKMYVNFFQMTLDSSVPNS